MIELRNVLVLFLLVSFNSFGQGILSDCIISRNDDRVIFSSKCMVSESDLFNDPNVFGGDDNNSFKLESVVKKDSNGVEVLKYRQCRFGYMTDSQLIIKKINGSVNRVSGGLDSSDFPSTPIVSVSSALTRLKDSLGITEYAWESHELEDGVIVSPVTDTFIVTDIITNGDTLWIDSIEGGESRMLLLDDTIGYWLTGRSFPSVDTILSSNKLEFRFTAVSRYPPNIYHVRVDAKNGEILSIRNGQFSAYTGSGLTVYNDVQNFQTERIGPFWLFWYRYKLFDDSRGDGIHTKYVPAGFSYTYNISISAFSPASEVIDGNNLWYKPKQIRAVSAHWAVQKAWDFFFDELGRLGWDALGRRVNVAVDIPYGPKSCSADFDSDHDEIVIYGTQNNDCDAAISLDIVAHEYAHGVAKYAYGFEPQNYFGESGALYESFADIFGTTIEYYVGNANDVWRIGEDIPNPLAVRSLSQPNSSTSNTGSGGQASWYEQPNYWVDVQFCTINTNCPIHINAGVQNHWFYLLSEGGSSPQPGNGTVVQGIGREKAALITYLNMTEHMQPTYQYRDARIGSILAAIDEFGACSFEVEQTINAWDAVNVHGSGLLSYDLAYPCNDLSENYVYALRDLNVACNYSNESSYKSLTAGRFLTLEPGFESNSDMHIRIEPCLANASGKQDDYPSYAGAGSAQPLLEQPPSEESSRQTILFPNPNRGSFAVKSFSPENAVIYDMAGRRVAEMELIDEHTLFISDMSSGTYLVRVQTANGSVENLKAVVAAP